MEHLVVGEVEVEVMVVVPEGRIIAEIDQDADVVLEDVKEVADVVNEVHVEEIDVVTTAKLITKVVTAASETITAASANITAAEAQVPAATTAVTLAVARDPAVKRYQVLKRKPQIKAQARKNMMVYLKNVVGFKMDYFKGMSYDDIRPIFEARFNSSVAFLLKTKEHIEKDENKALKRLNETLAERVAKRQKLDKEVAELKRHI
uniref:Uncharacterized protein n=1 Tax=Tanacetum cinerariifolium TaxID=118510 RepID=A0A699KDQ0_TANCI|nr:hypothetical protein [Tanacetum cinerariifolium]